MITINSLTSQSSHVYEFTRNGQQFSLFMFVDGDGSCEEAVLSDQYGSRISPTDDPELTREVETVFKMKLS